jgi:hypothetical protein
MPDIYEKFVMEMPGSRRFLVKWQNLKHLSRWWIN